MSQLLQQYVRQQVVDAHLGILAATSDATIASASTLDLTTVGGYQIDVTGNANINTITLENGREVLLRFTGAGLTLANGSSLLLLGGIDQPTLTNDWGIFLGGASSVVSGLSYSHADRYTKQTFHTIVMENVGDIRPDVSGVYYLGKAAPSTSGSYLIIDATDDVKLIRRDASASLRLNTSLLTSIRSQYFPDVDGTFVIEDATQDLTNKTYEGLTLAPYLHSNAGFSIRNIAQSVTLNIIGSDGAELNIGNGSVSGSNTGDQTITLSGDVTGSGTSSFSATIANDAVSLAKMANVSTGTVFYRKTASTGDPEVQTLATLKTDLGLTGTNSGDQTITLTGDVTGSGTSSFAATIANSAVTVAKLANLAGLSVIGRSGNTTGVTAAITGTDGQVLRVSGTALGFGTIVAAGIASDAVTTAKILDANVTLAKMANLATSTLIGRVTAGTGVPEAITAASGILTFLQTPNSANLAAAITDENGSGKLIFAAGTLAITSGKTATFSNTITFQGTDSTTMTFPTTSATLARTDAGNTFSGGQAISATGDEPLAVTTTVSQTNITALKLKTTNQTNSQNALIGLGTFDGNNYNTAFFSFAYIGTGSLSNNFGVSFWGTTNVFAVYPNGNIQTTGKIIAGAQVRFKGYTVATLPASPTQGDTAFVTDALTPTFLVAVVGGGAVVAPVFYNGAAWVTY